MKKYELTEETIDMYGRTLYRIKALRDFGDVKAGDLGGFVESEDNLCHYGTAWVHDNARVHGDAYVWGYAQVDKYASIYGNAEIWGSAHISESACVGGFASIGNNADIVRRADFLVVGSIGSRNDNTTFYRTGNAQIWVSCGCFSGDILEFLKAVDETHGENKHGQMYRLACELAKMQIDLT